MRNATGWLAVWALVSLTAFTAAPGGASARSAELYASTRLLLLKPSLLPAHYGYRGYKILYSLADWDQNIRQAMQIDEQNGWIEGAEERLRDPSRKDAWLSVQLFRSTQGAQQDWFDYFTNAHPNTAVFTPGQSWLGGSPVRRLGDKATIYRIQDDFSSCPEHVLSGVSFTYRNALFSTQTCTATAGDSGALDLARRLLKRARSVH